MAAAYRTLEVTFIQTELAFETLKECITFIEGHGGRLSDDRKSLVSKESAFVSQYSDRAGQVTASLS
jgi:hypothetical protein